MIKNGKQNNLSLHLIIVANSVLCWELGNFVVCRVSFAAFLFSVLHFLWVFHFPRTLSHSHLLLFSFVPEFKLHCICFDNRLDWELGVIMPQDRFSSVLIIVIKHSSWETTW